MRLVSDFYVLGHQFSDSTWNGRLYESAQEAVDDLKDSPHKSVLYVMKLSDFIWQASNKKLSPRAIKVSEFKGN